METCSKGRHHFKYKGTSRNRRSYRFRCTACKVRVIIFKNSFWRAKGRNALWLAKYE